MVTQEGAPPRSREGGWIEPRSGGKSLAQGVEGVNELQWRVIPLLAVMQGEEYARF